MPRSRKPAARTVRTLATAAAVVLLAAAVGIRATARSVRDNPAAITAAQYVGSTTCTGCHAAQHEAWQQSQHEQAMAAATPDRVLGDFEAPPFVAGHSETAFSRQGEAFRVRTEDEHGTPTEFDIAYTFGVDPIQQYLVARPDGRLQALSVAWDSRPAEAGGQRWFHLYADDVPPPGDELHWTGRQQNWNFMCADCHSTALRKNYDAGTDRFATTWSEISVGCEACHGPGSEHVRWARTPAWRRALGWRDNGLTIALDERRGIGWTIDPATARPVRSAPRTTDRELSVCAPCHSRRTQLADGFRPGLPLMDFYRPVTIAPGLFHPDGQQLDEVYTHTSFLQSRMAHAGVTCSDCHEPHSATLRAPGNALCAQCHLPARYDSADHHRHPTGSTGAACVACHMPERVYMQIDPRRDHSLRVPRPDLSVSLGVPNPCTDCHTDRNHVWAAARVEEWLGRPAAGFQTFAVAFAADERDAPGAAEGLAAIAGDDTQPPIVRASALERLARHPGPEAAALAARGLDDPAPEVRLAALQIAGALPPRDRLTLAAAALGDRSRAVRIEAARVVAGAGVGVRTAGGDDVVARAREELDASLRFNADRPETRNMNASLLAAAGRTDAAIAEYEAALRLAPDFTATYINLADLYSRLERERDAERVLRDGLVRAGDRAELHHALGLSLVRAGRRAEAVEALGRAARLAPEAARFGYAWAVALHSTGAPDRAIAVLEDVLARHPRDRDSLQALATFHRDAGRLDAARAAAARFAAAWPDDPAAAALVASLR